MPDRDLTLLSDAARAAGEIALRFWKRSPEVWDKGGGAGPVSEADLAVNRMLEAELRAARPGYGWLSEESPDGPERLGAVRVFILDPIDGTRAFLDGQDSWAHSFAVAEAGRIVAAVIFLPVKGLIYTAEAGGEALRNGARIAVSDTGLADASMLTARTSMTAEHWRDGLIPPVDVSFRASLAYRMALVAEGAFSAMLTVRPCWEWDSAAGALILERAGAVVTDKHGAPLHFNAPDPRSAGVLAAGPGLHADLAGRLRR